MMGTRDQHDAGRTRLLMPSHGAMRPGSRLLSVCGVAVLLVASSGMADDTRPADAAADNVDFVSQIRPIFQKHCYECHGPEMQESGLRLDRKDEALAGGDSGQVIVPGQASDSLIIELIRGEDPDRVMPPTGETLTREQIELLRRWIDAGAQWPDGIDGEDQRPVHWAYQPLQRMTPPTVDAAQPQHNPIDAFIQARLLQEGLTPSPEADRYTLAKRLYYDLLGLPPTPEAADRFVFSTSPRAYAELVDELLQSPHFGERWGRHWLDMARYADSDGYEKDRPRYHAWRYRDWVIDAINRDLPFDQFTVEQLAGDLLNQPSDEQLVATGFNRQTLTNTEGGVDQEEFRNEAIFDRVETLGSVWLGLTVGCARCHSHKYDRISQREYYQFFAFFNNADESNEKLPSTRAAAARYRDEHAAWKAQLLELEAPLQTRREMLLGGFDAWLTSVTDADDAAKLPNEIQKVLAVAPEKRDAKQQEALLEHFLKQDAEYAALAAPLTAHRKREPFNPVMDVAILKERNEPRVTHVFRRGSFLEPLGAVDPGVLGVLHTLPRPEDRPLNRLDLARWLVSPENPLTPRVAVNQVWMHLFGQGLVKTASDFGVRGDAPSHPELLDWLATEFLRLGWSRKELIRTIVLSHTYRQASIVRPETLDFDGENRLLSRQNRLRVEGEIVRDLYLASSGLLEPRIGGPSVFPPLPPGIAELSYANNFKWGESEWNQRPDRPHATPPREDVHRRGMYTFFKRTAAHPNLTNFDCPDANTSCISRKCSNTPLQALQTLNNETFLQSGGALARRVLQSDAADDAERIEQMFRLCLIRPPSEFESSALASLLADARSHYAAEPESATGLSGSFKPAELPAPEFAAWLTVARVVLNLDEFVTRE